jgi:hypothetical protein
MAKKITRAPTQRLVDVALLEEVLEFALDGSIEMVEAWSPRTFMSIDERDS